MTKLIKGIHHIALKCCGMEAFEKTKKFYGEVLGLEEVRCWGEGLESGCMYCTGAGLIEIFANGEEDKDQGAIRHFALAAYDTDACVKAVKEAGYQVTMEPNNIVIPSDPPYPARIAFCIGPVGEEIEFFQCED